jgi:hypothetical protein
VYTYRSNSLYTITKKSFDLKKWYIYSMCIYFTGKNNIMHLKRHIYTEIVQTIHQDPSIRLMILHG